MFVAKVICYFYREPALRISVDLSTRPVLIIILFNLSFNLFFAHWSHHYRRRRNFRNRLLIISTLTIDIVVTVLPPTVSQNRFSHCISIHIPSY